MKALKSLLNYSLPLVPSYDTGNVAEDSLCFALYVLKYNSFPNISTFKEIDGSKFGKQFLKNRIILKETIKGGNVVGSQEIFSFDDKLFVALRNRFDRAGLTPWDDLSPIMDFSLASQACVFYKEKKDIKFIEDFFKKNPLKKNERELGLVVMEYKELSLKNMPIKNIDIDFDLNYNADFKQAHKLIVDKLKTQTKGIVFLHGVPGSGKTSYLRWLIANIEKRFIYLPPDLSYILSQPDFLSFLINYPNAILIIEDGENVLLDRTTNKDNAVSNILNLSDGLLSDCLNIQIIVTYNVKGNELDAALFRKGRVICDYEFGTLSEDRVVKLCKKLKKHIIKKSVTLGEIYYDEEDDFAKPQRGKIGLTK